MHKRQWFPRAALAVLGVLVVACGGGDGGDDEGSDMMRPAVPRPTAAPDRSNPVVSGRPMLAPAVVITAPSPSAACLPARPCPGGVNPAAAPGAVPVAPPALPGTAGAPALADTFPVERQACVDYINMYRASAGIPPLGRGTPEQEACTDAASKKDGDSGQHHSSYSDCAHLGLSSQNTCPSWPVDPGSTLTASMQNCFDMMWAEGAPPQGVDACIADATGCYQTHGHWITMATQQATVVACGFYLMPDGTYWMNQNFGM